MMNFVSVIYFATDIWHTCIEPPEVDAVGFHRQYYYMLDYCKINWVILHDNWTTIHFLEWTNIMALASMTAVKFDRFYLYILLPWRKKKLTCYSMMEDLRKSLGYSRLNNCGLDPCTSYQLSLRVSLSVMIIWGHGWLTDFGV